MKVKIEDKGFQPTAFHITVESEDELKSLYTIFNVAPRTKMDTHSVKWNGDKFDKNVNSLLFNMVEKDIINRGVK